MNPLYLITYSYFDRRVGRQFTGTHDLEDHTREGVTFEIANDHVAGVTRVYECIPGGACTDITREIADAVAQYLRTEQEPISYRLICWLHQFHPQGVMGTFGIPLAA